MCESIYVISKAAIVQQQQASQHQGAKFCSCGNSNVMYTALSTSIMSVVVLLAVYLPEVAIILACGTLVFLAVLLQQRVTTPRGHEVINNGLEQYVSS